MKPQASAGDRARAEALVTKLNTLEYVDAAVRYPDEGDEFELLVNVFSNAASLDTSLTVYQRSNLGRDRYVVAGMEPGERDRAGVAYSTFRKAEKALLAKVYARLYGIGKPARISDRDKAEALARRANAQLGAKEVSVIDATESYDDFEFLLIAPVYDISLTAYGNKRSLSRGARRSNERFMLTTQMTTEDRTTTEYSTFDAAGDAFLNALYTAEYGRAEAMSIRRRERERGPYGPLPLPGGRDRRTGDSIKSASYKAAVRRLKALAR